jgi:hypothetical protein
MMGEALHDTVDAPEIAANFRCLPEQLLRQLDQIQVPDNSQHLSS